MYVVSNDSEEGLGGSSSYTNIAKARHEEGIHGEKASQINNIVNNVEMFKNIDIGGLGAEELSDMQVSRMRNILRLMLITYRMEIMMH